MNSPRFKVTSIHGAEIRPERAGKGGRILGPTYSVLDTHVCYREVASFSATSSARSSVAQKRHAEALAATLNADPLYA